MPLPIRVGLGLFVIEVSLAALVSACSAVSPSVPSGGAEGRPSSETTSANQWDLVFEYEGGIAGLKRAATIDSTGQAIFRDRRSDKTITTTLTSEEARQLSRLVLAGDVLRQKEDQRTPSCRDCLTYSLEAQLGGHRRRIIADDQGLSETLRPLIEWLVERTNRALQST